MNRQKNIYETGIRMCRGGNLCLVFSILVFLFSTPVFAGEDIFIRTTVTPDEVWVGQMAVLHIDVLSRDAWAQITKMGDIKIKGAYTLSVQTQGTRLSERIDGNTYTGQRYERLIFPQVGGTVTIPSFPVDVEVKVWGANAEDNVIRMSTQGATFNVNIPPGAEEIRGLITATELTAGQTWEPETDSVKIGDAIERVITFEARDVSGMAFTPLEFQKIEGVGVYPGEPDVSDNTNRGALTGKRIEKVTYFFEQSGSFQIPGISFVWWDSENTELKRVELPGKKIEIAAATAGEGSIQKKILPAWIVILCAIVPALVLTFIFRGRLESLRGSWKKLREEREIVYFRNIIKAARSGDAGKTLRETMAWLDRINPGFGIARLDLFLDVHGDDRAKKEIAELSLYMGNNDPIPDIPALIDDLKKVRRHWKQSSKKEKQAERLLPELNG